MPTATPKERTNAFVPVPKGQLRADMKAALLSSYAATGTIKEACDMAGVPTSTAYLWRREDTEFATTWDDITRNQVVPMLEQRAIERASEKSDLLLMFLLKAYKREMYDDRQAAAPTPPDTGLTLVFNEVPAIKDVNDPPVQHLAGPDGPAEKP